MKYLSVCDLPTTKQPKGSLSLKTVMADLIRHLPSSQTGFCDRRSRVKRRMTGGDEWDPEKSLSLPICFLFLKEWVLRICYLKYIYLLYTNIKSMPHTTPVTAYNKRIFFVSSLLIPNFPVLL